VSAAAAAPFTVLAGYPLAFVVGGVFSALAAGLAVTLLRDRPMVPHGEAERAPALAVETD